MHGAYREIDGRGPERVVRVNEQDVFFVVNGDGSITVDESASEQCEGCGLDIAETGAYRDRDRALMPHGLVRCTACGVRYPVRLVSRDWGRITY